MKSVIKASGLLLLGLALSLPVWAGGAKDKDGGSAQENKFIIFQSKVEITTQFEAVAAAYQKEKGVEVEVWSTTGDTYFQQLRTRLANNQGPTFFSVGGLNEAEQIKNYLADLSDLPFLSDINESMLGKSDDGKVNGVPFTLEGFGMVYNKKLINPATVTDYNSFVKMLQDFKAKGINGFGLSQESYFLIGHILNTPFALQSDPNQFMDRLNKGEVKMADNREFQEFARFYAAIRDNSYNPLEMNYDREIGDFATGKTASIHQGNWAYGMFSDYKLDFEMGLMPFPLMGNNKLAVSNPGVWVINSQALAAQQKLAKDFFIWLYTSETGKRFMTEEFGFIPVVKGMTSKNIDPLSAEVARYAQEGNTLTWMTRQYPASIVNVHLVPVAQQFFASKMTPQEFLVALDAAWAKAVAK
ncbi:ABC transporter substrate-binding protein [Spirochaetia bacterium]|nr:ABC transporter substrate-binding protein [Spirochaetia bacterium]